MRMVAHTAAVDVNVAQTAAADVNGPRGTQRGERRWQTAASAMDLALTAKRNLSPGEPATQPSPIAKARGRSVPVPRGLNIPPVVVP
eukprot:8216115-Prorocentrum_lima.AAC.1